ncbi:MAG: hypothetical protein ABIO60_06915 [Aquaticitalea sp.]
MTKKNWSILKYAIPILALLIIVIQFGIVNATNLNKWKGGGFGMYTEVHCYYNEVYIKHLEHSLDSLRTIDFPLDQAIKKAKCLPNTYNLREIAKLVSKYGTDTITVQIWKPLVEAQSNSYSRELVNEFQFIKP